MGKHLVNAVFFGLEGVAPDVLFPIPAKGKKGRQFRAFGGDEMAILAAVAHRQPDPGFRGNVDTFAYGDIQTMLDLSHVGRSSFFEKRDALVQWKLLSYAKEQKLPDVTGAGGMKTYSNVYRINLEGIRKCRSGLSDAEWARNILRISDEERMRMSGDVLRALQISRGDSCGRAAKSVRNADGAVQSADGGLQNADGGVQTADCAVQNTDTNTINNTKTKTKEQPTPTRPVMVDGADDDWVLFMMNRAAEACGRPLEQINEKVFRDAIRDKYTRSVANLIKPSDPGNLNNPIGGLIKRLQGLPEPEKDSAWLRDCGRGMRLSRYVLTMWQFWDKMVEILEFEKLSDDRVRRLRADFYRKGVWHASWELWAFHLIRSVAEGLGIDGVKEYRATCYLQAIREKLESPSACASEFENKLSFQLDFRTE